MLACFRTGTLPFCLLRRTEVTECYPSTGTRPSRKGSWHYDSYSGGSEFDAWPQEALSCHVSHGFIQFLQENSGTVPQNKLRPLPSQFIIHNILPILRSTTDAVEKNR
jgi:hypothetical protein